MAWKLQKETFPLLWFLKAFLPSRSDQDTMLTDDGCQFLTAAPVGLECVGAGLVNQSPSSRRGGTRNSQIFLTTRTSTRTIDLHRDNKNIYIYTSPNAQHKPSPCSLLLGRFQGTVRIRNLTYRHTHTRTSSQSISSFVAWCLPIDLTKTTRSIVPPGVVSKGDLFGLPESQNHSTPSLGGAKFLSVPSGPAGAGTALACSFFGEGLARKDFPMKPFSSQQILYQCPHSKHHTPRSSKTLRLVVLPWKICDTFAPWLRFGQWRASIFCQTLFFSGRRAQREDHHDILGCADAWGA